jgi:competence ComEA-like helix-hairpin-helix protein
MESETHESMEQAPSTVDLNQATEEDLIALPGIGPALARRILDYREVNGPFSSPEEILKVNGIGPAIYADLADYLIHPPAEVLPEAVPELAPPEETIEHLPPAAEVPELAAPEEVVEELPAEEVIELAPPEEAVEEPPAEEVIELPPPEEMLEGISPEAALPEAEITTEPLPLDEAPVVAEAGPPPEEAPPAKPRERPLPPKPVPRRRDLSWVGAVVAAGLLGGLLGVLLSLLAFYGINGSVNVAQTRAMRDSRAQIRALASELETLQGEAESMQLELDELSGLPDQMREMGEAVSNFDQQLGIVEGDLKGLQEDFAAVQSQAERVEYFFLQLRELLNELFQEE